MAKASDLIGRSGAGGPSNVPGPKPKGDGGAADTHKNPTNHGSKTPRGGQAQGGGGKAPVARRPKV